ncbi:hypothetical protein D3C76_1732750 [compost metagenome]
MLRADQPRTGRQQGQGFLGNLLCHGSGPAVNGLQGEVLQQRFGGIATQTQPGKGANALVRQPVLPEAGECCHQAGLQEQHAGNVQRQRNR